MEFQGFRLSAQPFLHIDALLYGSDNAGRTVHCDPQIDGFARRIATALHLMPHPVNSTLVGVDAKQTTNPSSQSKPILATAIDIEVRLAKDGKNAYFMDMARAFPPEDPQVSSERSNSINLAEYLSIYLNIYRTCVIC